MSNEQRIQELQDEIDRLRAEDIPAPKVRYNIAVLADESQWQEFAPRVRDALAAVGMDFDGGYYAPEKEQPRAWVGNPLLDEEGYDRMEGEHAILSVGRGIDRTDIAAPGVVKFRIGEYLSDTYTNPIWEDVVHVVDASIAVTGDFHHVFVEDVVQRVNVTAGMGIAVYEVVLGS